MAKDLSLIWQMGVVGAAGAYSSMEKMTQSLSKVKDGTEELSKAQRKLEKLDKLRKNFVSLNQEYINASKHLQKLKEEYDRSGKGNAEFVKRVKESEKYIEKLNKQKERQKHLFKAARSELEKEGITLNNYKKKLEETNKALEKQRIYKEQVQKASEYQTTADEFSKKGSSQLKMGAAIGGALLVPVKMYADLEESQADLRKILGEEAKKYYDDLAEISNNNPLSQIEMNEIAGSLAQSGIKGDDIVAYSKMAGEMKVAFDISTEEAGNFLAKTKEQLNLSKDDLFSYMDTLNMLSNNYSVTAAQLADVSGRTAGFAKEIGLAKEANMAFATTLISSNVNAEQTSTVLGKLYSELAQGANTKAKATALDYLGLDSSTIHEQMAKDTEGTILKVLEKIKNSSAADKAALITDIFGSDKAVINGISVLSGNLDGVREKLQKVKEEVSDNEKVHGEYEERINTLTQQFKIMRNNFINGLMDIGKSVGPELKETVQSLSNWMKSMGAFIKEHPKLVAALVKLVAGFAAFQLGAGFMNKSIIPPLVRSIGWFTKFNAAKNLGGFTHALKTMFPLTSKVLGVMKNVGSIGGKVLLRGLFNFIKIAKMAGVAIKAAFMANPIGFLIAAIVAAIAIFVVLFKKVEWFRNGVITIFEGIKLYFEGIWKIIVGIFSGNFNLIKQGFASMVEGIQKIWEGFVGIVSKTWDKITGFFKKTKEQTKELQEAGSKTKEANPAGLTEHWSGTNYFTGGFTSLAERGAELVEMAGSSFLAMNPMVANLPKGARILNNTATRKSLSDRVQGMREKLQGITNKNYSNSMSIGGTSVVININGAQNPTNIAQEIKKVLMEIDSKKRRTAIV
ncbi:MAG TPA: phage tail tape measure protein [Fusobacterium sp.]|uniref:phage tail tape measure protein n=1 Tax=Fusobacterium sp. TaxID=68766 RepID=UPI002F3E593B